MKNIQNTIPFKNIKIQHLLPYIGLVTIIVLFTILTGGKTISPTNISLLFQQSLTLLICCTGVFFVMAMGSLDFSQGSILCLACYVSGYICSNVNILLGILAALGIGAGIGALNGLIHTKGRVDSFIATLCTMFIFKGFNTYMISNYNVEVSLSIRKMDNLSIELIVVVGLMLIGFLIFRFTSFGRNIKAIGANEIAAKFSGVKVMKVKFLAFLIAGMMAGLAGYFTLVRTGNTAVGTGSLMETNVMIALVIGGQSITGGSKSKFSAIWVGTLILTVMVNGLVMIHVDTVIQQLIKALIFIALIIITMDRKNAVVIK